MWDCQQTIWPTKFLLGRCLLEKVFPSIKWLWLQKSKKINFAAFGPEFLIVGGVPGRGGTTPPTLVITRPHSFWCRVGIEYRFIIRYLNNGLEYGSLFVRFPKQWGFRSQLLLFVHHVLVDGVLGGVTFHVWIVFYVGLFRWFFCVSCLSPGQLISFGGDDWPAISRWCGSTAFKPS